MRMISVIFALSLACLAVVGSTISSIAGHLFSIIPRFSEPKPFAYNVEPRSIFDTRRMGLA